jgi:hypothetical protein
MVRASQATSAEEPDGGNLHVRIWRGPGLRKRLGLLYSPSASARAKLAERTQQFLLERSVADQDAAMSDEVAQTDWGPDTLGALSRGLDQIVRQEIRGALVEEFQALGDAGRHATEALEAVRRVASARTAVWAVAVVLACAVVPLAVAWIMLPSPAQLERLRAARDELEANVALLDRRGGRIDLRRCGPAGRLCVRVERAAPAYGSQADYLIVKGY